MQRNMIVSIFPSYICQNNCNFCYLQHSHTNQLLDLDVLRLKLKEITSIYKIHKFNLYGGEITLLPIDYLQELNEILESYNIDNFVTSNLYNIERLKIFKNAYWSTSLNLERPDYDYIKDILKKNILNHKIAILSMITPSIVNSNPKEVLLDYNGLNIEYISFIKYYPSINTGDVFNISQDIYENTLKNLLKTYMENRNLFDFDLAMRTDLDACIKRRYPIATNDQCIRIGPDGRFGAIYYNQDNLEDFKWYNTIEEYEKDCKEEVKAYRKKCGFCPYFGTCWTEHITNLKCDGCKNLLDWWKSYEYK